MDRNSEPQIQPTKQWRSLSARRAWIEIIVPGHDLIGQGVALRKESVDRNTDHVRHTLIHSVALRKESVDRNLIDEIQLEFNSVALRKESVDRNVNLRVVDESKSVALRKESVDRNAYAPVRFGAVPRSLSARRAWIEI